MALFSQSFRHLQHIFFYYVFNDTKAWILSWCKSVIAGLPSTKSCCFTPADSDLDIQAGLQGSVWPFCLHFGLDTHFPSQEWSVFYQSKSPPNASLQATKKPVAHILTKNSKLSWFCRHKTWFNLFHRWSPRAAVPTGSQQSCSKGQSIGGCQLLSLSCCRQQGTEGSLIPLAPCSIGDHGTWTESSPETHRNRVPFMV